MYIVKHNKNIPYSIIITRPIIPEPAKTNANIIGIISAVKAMVINTIDKIIDFNIVTIIYLVFILSPYLLMRI